MTSGGRNSPAFPLRWPLPTGRGIPMRRRLLPALLGGLLITASAHAATPDRWQVPVSVKKLDNGLTVVVSEDHSSPTIGVSMVYHVGMRLEPKNRTGFAHLFEHLMFEGTPH